MNVAAPGENRRSALTCCSSHSDHVSPNKTYSSTSVTVTAGSCSVGLTVTTVNLKDSTPQQSSRYHCCCFTHRSETPAHSVQTFILNNGCNRLPITCLYNSLMCEHNSVWSGGLHGAHTECEPWHVQQIHICAICVCQVCGKPASLHIWSRKEKRRSWSLFFVSGGRSKKKKKKLFSLILGNITVKR